MRETKRKMIMILSLILTVAVVCGILSVIVTLVKDAGDDWTADGSKIVYTKSTESTESGKDAVKTGEDSSFTLDHIPTDAEMEALVTEKLLTNPETRPCEKSESVDYIVIHYVANPGASAINHYTYFNQNFEYPSSCHYIVGLEGEIYRFIPDDEVAYHAGKTKNYNSIGIEVCHPDESGKFTDETYLSLLKLVSWLCEKYGIDEEHLIRHYDVTGKMCPIYFVYHEDEWLLFKSRVFMQ